jgi:hypothetical protein
MVNVGHGIHRYRLRDVELSKENPELGFTAKGKNSALYLLSA